MEPGHPVLSLKEVGIDEHVCSCYCHNGSSTPCRECFTDVDCDYVYDEDGELLPEFA